MTSPPPGTQATPTAFAHPKGLHASARLSQVKATRSDSPRLPGVRECSARNEFASVSGSADWLHSCASARVQATIPSRANDTAPAWPGLRFQAHGFRGGFLALTISAMACGTSGPTDSTGAEDAGGAGSSTDGHGGDEPPEGIDGVSPRPDDASFGVDATADASSVLGAVDAHDDAPRTEDASPVGTDAALGCPASCPAGQITVNWSESSPGFPGPSGCECQPNPCDGGTTNCSAYSACQALSRFGGCDYWSGETLGCFQCG